MVPFTSAPLTHAEYPERICAAAAAACPLDTVLAPVNVPVTAVIRSSSALSPIFTVVPYLILAAFKLVNVTAFIV